jgi:hypothetical protein
VYGNLGGYFGTQQGVRPTNQQGMAALQRRRSR